VTPASFQGFVPDEPVPVEVERLLDEPDRHGDLVDFLLMVAIAILLVLSVGFALFIIDGIWDMVGLGEGADVGDA
jgi:hypothetical protein